MFQLYQFLRLQTSNEVPQKQSLIRRKLWSFTVWESKTLDSSWTKLEILFVFITVVCLTNRRIWATWPKRWVIYFRWNWQNFDFHQIQFLGMSFNHSFFSKIENEYETIIYNQYYGSFLWFTCSKNDKASSLFQESEKLHFFVTHEKPS